MSKIRIKNFGPVKEGFQDNGGWIDIKKVTVFIGGQGSGKSTLAKLIATFMGLEKALNKGDFTEQLTGADMLNLLDQQRLKNYIQKDSEIEYIGDLYTISYTPEKTWPVIKKKENGIYLVPKIMYVPAERNLFSTLPNVYDLKTLPDFLRIFGTELKQAQVMLAGTVLELPLRGTTYEYREHEDASYIKTSGSSINLLEASSGFHSLIPLFLVSRNLAELVANKAAPDYMSVNQIIKRDKDISQISLDTSISNDERAIKISNIYNKYFNQCFINIVEEPEQNLFPTSQKEILESLSAFNNKSEGNKLIVTTHSPYIINFLSIAIQGQILLDKIKTHNRNDLLGRFEEIIPENSCMKANETVIYELDKEGNIIRLKEYGGIPSDDNYLNASLSECNQLFDSLFEIEEDL